MGVNHERNEYRFTQLEENSVDCIFTDPPFLISRLADGEHVIGGFEQRVGFRREMGDWDLKFDPVSLIYNSARVLKPGGWFIAKTGDATLGLYRDLLSRDHVSTPAYLDFFARIYLISEPEKRRAMTLLPLAKEQKHFEYKATITWHRTNAPVRIRKTTYQSSCEWFVAAKRLGPGGETVEPVAWNFLSQREMRNFMRFPSAMGGKRLYWHVRDPESPDGRRVTGGEIVPCRNPNRCVTCLEAKAYSPDSRPLHLQRRNHPTQTPLSVWRWLMKRHTVPGLTLYDPYAGTGSSGIVAREYGCNWIGSEADWEFATVGQMWLAGRWQAEQEKRHSKYEIGSMI